MKLDKVELGVSFQRALAGKYFASLLPEAATKGQFSEAVDNVEYTDSKGREKAITVELVGRYGIEQRQQRLESFHELALVDTCLETRYPEDVWQGDWCLPNCKSLWLDKTLLRDWADIPAICELCPQLEWLSLARTRLDPLPPGGALPVPRGAPVVVCDARIVLQPFVCRVRTLVLSNSMVTWAALLVVDAAGLFPCLEHLHLANNRLAEGIPVLEPGLEGEHRRPFPKLKSMVLDGNGISDWRVLHRAITAFPGLGALHLNNNLLGEGSLEGLSDMAADETPRMLTALFLNENRLASWQAIGVLSAYALLELKAQRIPLTEGDSSVASPLLLRQIFIALMPTLSRLNASEVTVKERTASERYFLTLAQQQGHRIIQALSETCDVAAHAARLRGIHGDVVGGGASEEAQASRSALSNALVEVILRPIGAAIVEQQPAKKRVPHTMTVGELKRLCHLLFKQVPLDRVRLVLADPGLPFGVPFDDDSRELGFYGVGDGAEIRVDDAADAVAANAKAAKAEAKARSRATGRSDGPV